jgi:hypothetical protein
MRLHHLWERVSQGARTAAGAQRAAQLSLAAVVFGLVGAVGGIRELPTVLLAVVLTAFVFLGPGTLVLSWYPGLPLSALAALIPAVSAAVCLVTLTGLLLLGIYSPVVTLLALTFATAACGLARWRYVTRRRGAAPGATP